MGVGFGQGSVPLIKASPEPIMARYGVFCRPLGHALAGAGAGGATPKLKPGGSWGAGAGAEAATAKGLASGVAAGEGTPKAIAAARNSGCNAASAGVQLAPELEPELEPLASLAWGFPMLFHFRSSTIRGWAESNWRMSSYLAASAQQ